MKLLIITQVVDSQHPILGFFHRWIEEFAKHCDCIHVICLQEGWHNLPKNVIVHSLGKEEGKGRLYYLVRFHTLIWQLRHEYDSVFVHMNQMYVLLGAPVWYLLRKRIGLWYMHGAVSVTLKIAEKLASRIFTGSLESFRVPSKKVSVTGHGIDISLFAPRPVTKDIDLITVGRITEVKNLTTIVAALKELRKTHPATLTIVGTALTADEQRYEAHVKNYITEQELEKMVVWYGHVPQTLLPPLLNRAKIFVTTAQNGSLDKAVLEAMACGVAVVSSAPGSASLPLGAAYVLDPASLVLQLETVLKSGVYTHQEYVEYVTANHSLQSLIPKIIYGLT